MLTKLIPTDDIPLKLGNKVEPKTELTTGAVPAGEFDGVKWVRDERAPMSDMAHPAAEMESVSSIISHELSNEIDAFWKRLETARDDAMAQSFAATEIETETYYGPSLCEMLARMAPPSEIDAMRPRCYGCGASHGEKHFFSCYAVRPSLLDER